MAGKRGMGSGMGVPVEATDWRAESDARTLVEAEVIKGDAKRHKAACAAAKKMIKAKKDEAESLLTIAGEGCK